MVYNEEVLYTDESIIKVKSQDINQLKNQAALNKRKRIRLCTHRDTTDRIHEMLIILPRSTYIRPHKHLNKIESFHIIEGSANVIIFNEKGDIINVIPMGNYASERNFYYRISDPYYHTVYIITDFLVFHETTNGPFKRSDTVFAPWAPEENDKFAVNEFMEQLTKSIELFNQVKE
jgi:cupin fold WbuC family metalloprotein